MNAIVSSATRHPALASTALAAALACGLCGPAQALTFSSGAEVYGYISTSYTSPYLGNISFNIPGTSDYQYSQPGSPNPNASATYTIDPNNAPGTDPVYDIVTAGGAFGFGYTGTAHVTGTSLHAAMSSSQVDASGQPVSSAGQTSVSAWSYASWNQTMYVAPNLLHPLGSYGAILMGITLDGSFSPIAPGDSGSGSASLQISSNFTDAAGVSYQSSFYLSSGSWDSSWTGSATAYKKLLFQYGTAFNLNSYMYTSTSGNATANFINTGKVTSIEVPFGAILQTGAEEAGLGSPGELYGTVFNSATLDAPNTNWDFGNNGGGFTPGVPVPEPGSWALLAVGLGTVGFIARRRRD